MNTSILAAMLAVIGYSCLNVGQAGQKIGLSMKEKQPLRGWLAWVFATTATAVSFVLVFIAISIGSLAVVGAMAGTGLVSLTVFSGLVLKERIRLITVVAIIVVVCAAAVIALFDQEQDSSLSVGWLYVILGGGVTAYCAGILLAPSARGVFIGGFSGFLGAYSQLFQRLSTDDVDLTSGALDFIATVATNPITLIWVGLSFASMVVVQFAYRHATAIRIVPVFTANFILIPVIGAVVVFGERLQFAQWIAIAAMIAGAVVLSLPAAPRLNGVSE